MSASRQKASEFRVYNSGHVSDLFRGQDASSRITKAGINTTLANGGASMCKQPRKRIVFVVDDERIIVVTLQLILRHEGYVSRSFNRPDEAIKAAQVDSPDLLITDLIMPGMNGIQLANQVRHTCPRCRVILCSGQTSMTDLLERGNVDGIPIDSFLLKPVHPRVLLEEVEEIMKSESMAPA